jgi:hypothetical protein
MKSHRTRDRRGRARRAVPVAPDGSSACRKGKGSLGPTCSLMTARTLPISEPQLSCSTQSCRTLLRLSDRCGAPDLPFQCAHIDVCSGLGRPPMGGRFRSFERLGYSKRYFLSEMFVRVAALCLRSTVLPRRGELGFAERSVLAARTAALDSRSRCNLLATGQWI